MFFIKLLGLLIVAAGGYFIYQLLNPGPPPELNPHEWWGLNELKGKLDHSVKAFEIKFDETVINDLKKRLKNPRPFTPPLEEVGFEYGFNSNELQPWLNYWADEYPFAEREAFLNKFPQFKTNVQGLDIHFVRVKPRVQKGVQTVPLLLIHGWPGSFREFYEAIPLLTQEQPGYDFAFEVVVPSLPGYGFSQTPVRSGLGAAQTAVIFRNLMQRLGHKKFFVQGGDWGSRVGSAMATLYPEDVLGYHTNMALTFNGCAMFRIFVGSWFPSLIMEKHLVDRLYPVLTRMAGLLEETGYFHIQATKPDTVGVGLTDSPTGLLAYILEKFSTWTKTDYKYKQDGGLTLRFSKNQLIDNLMIYWISNSITTSMRFYLENSSKEVRKLRLESYPTKVPTWALQAKEEMLYQPPSVLRTKFTNLLNVTVLDEGGHFLAFEMPKTFAKDLFKAVNAFRAWHQRNIKTEL